MRRFRGCPNRLTCARTRNRSRRCRRSISRSCTRRSRNRCRRGRRAMSLQRRRNPPPARTARTPQSPFPARPRSAMPPPVAGCLRRSVQSVPHRAPAWRTQSRPDCRARRATRATRTARANQCAPTRRRTARGRSDAAGRRRRAKRRDAGRWHRRWPRCSRSGDRVHWSRGSPPPSSAAAAHRAPSDRHRQPSPDAARRRTASRNARDPLSRSSRDGRH